MKKSKIIRKLLGTKSKSKIKNLSFDNKEKVVYYQAGVEKNWCSLKGLLKNANKLIKKVNSDFHYIIRKDGDCRFIVLYNNGYKYGNKVPNAIHKKDIVEQCFKFLIKDLKEMLTKYKDM